ncbi:odorant receptor 131-2-like [Spea bombifrons]|uniref:odorant receptor 131-2-like n=1 Tax=Spea bombifrons TaxID=233779 RepID=UPI00234A44AF|nr:odorant receptor 131-2-like [Spea bombifrons]
MENSTSPSGNIFQITSFNSKAAEIVRTVLVILTLLCFCFFIYFIAVILNVYFTAPHVKENARYILFAHMLIIDTLYLVTGLILLLCALYVIYIPVPICYTILTLASSTFRITPYNLAAMALERYIAVCYPLRHVTFCTPSRSNVAIATMCVIGLIPNVADFIVLSTSVNRKYFSIDIICSRDNMIFNALQRDIRSFATIISLTLVAVIILLTYIKVMMVARQISSGSSSAFKAGKTVMLHAFQLLLCMTSLTSSFTEPYFKNNVMFFVIGNFLLFMCLPRFLSPLIYGIRDEAFKQCFRKLYNFKTFINLKIKSSKCDVIAS